MKNSKKTNRKSAEPRMHFPVVKGPMYPASIRSVDEINTWIEQDYPYLFNREVYEKYKKLHSVNKKFTLT